MAKNCRQGKSIVSARQNLEDNLARVDEQQIPQALDSHLLAKLQINKIPMRVMLDCGTAGGNLISKTQIDLQGFKTRNLKTPIKLRTAIKGSYYMIYKVADLEIDWQRYYKTTRTFFVAPLDEVDTIIGIKN